MTAQELLETQRDATTWWVSLLHERRVELCKRYIGTSLPKTLSSLEVIYCYLYNEGEDIN